MENRVARVAVSAAAYQIDKLYDYVVPQAIRDAAAPGMRVSVPFSKGNRHVEGVIMEMTDSSDYLKLKSIDALLDETPVLTENQLKLAKWMKVRFFCTVFDAVKAMLPAGLWFRAEHICSIAEGVDKEKAYTAAGGDSLAERLLDCIYAAGGTADLNALRASFGEKVSKALKTLESAGVVRSGLSGKRKANDRTVSVAHLIISAEEALEIAEAKRRSAAQQASVLKLLAEIGEADVKEICYFTGAAMQSVRALEKRGYIELERREVFRIPNYDKSEAPSIQELNGQQTEAYLGLKELLEEEKASAALLYGVTGSGKTAVYIKLISRCIEMGRQAIVMVPEIALTPQLMATFRGHFGERVAVLHSSLSIGERYDEWKRIKSGLVDVVVGTRSAVFAPVSRLGLLIMDEEQEYTYKSENNPRYHARDVAKFICVQENALLLLGSATPSVESMYGAVSGKYKLFRMDRRYNQKALPGVIIADMKSELRGGNGGSLSSVLCAELEKNLRAGEQSILFINRRGSSSAVTCTECGNTFQCPSCSANLTYHSANNRLMCHYCGYSRPVYSECPECGHSLQFIGAGTQRVEEELKLLYPGVEVMRMDTDTVTASRSHEVILAEFVKKKIPILIGTQMVAKGLNLENVTLVGVISPDQMLYSGDYRARERTFNLITQVVGRSGRGSKAGRAVIQTLTPDNEVIRCAAAQDYDSFYRGEIELRKILNLPPFSELYSIMVSGMDEAKVLRCCSELKEALLKSISTEGVQILGPASAHILKVNNRYRYRVYLRCPPSKEARALIAAAIRRYSSDKRYKGVSVFGDIDPMD
ncbi:MAG: primosomal protein N' [Clostridiales bacterium]|nr:primosomal protein N' [Clostridiales bacterium]